jgi:hypothetical protein
MIEIQNLKKKKKKLKTRESNHRSSMESGSAWERGGGGVEPARSKGFTRSKGVNKHPHVKTLPNLHVSAYKRK